jgi:glycosyltransferase involved in cell wall biosynthesis
MSKEEVMRWLSMATCTLFVVKDVPFLATASPNKIFDSFAAGVPVIQATTGWIGELIERERCGLNAATTRPEAMADAVMRVVDDPALQRCLAQNARRVAHSLFDRDLLAAKMRVILRQSAQGA